MGFAIASACATNGSEDGCGASEYQNLIGVDVAAISLPASLNHRIIGPDTSVTLDYRTDRLNIHHDTDGIVFKVECG